MIRIISEIVFRSIRGKLSQTLSGLRKPVFVISIIAFCLLMAVPVSMILTDTRTSVSVSTPDIPESVSPVVGTVIPLMIILAFSVLWLLPRKLPVMKLTEAETLFFLPAPVSERHVIQYMLYKQQLNLLFSSLIFTVIRIGLPFHQPFRFVKTLTMIWLMLALFDLHYKGCSLWKLVRRKLSASQNALISGVMLFLPVFLIVGFWVAVLPGIIQSVRDLSMGAEHFEIPGLLIPLVNIATPIIQRSELFNPAPFLIIVALIIFHHEWVIKFQRIYQEIGQEISRKKIETDVPLSSFWSSLKISHTSHPFKLRPTGNPLSAIVWKSFIQFTRVPVIFIVLISIGIFTFLVYLPNYVGQSSTVSGVFIFIGMLMIFNSCFLNFGNDIHFDFLNFDTVKAWPVSGFRLIMGKIISSALISCFIGFMGMGLVYISTLFSVTNHDLKQYFGILALTAIPTFLGISALFSTLHCCPPILLPRYFAQKKTKQGYADTGLKTLKIRGMLISLCICLIPVALTALTGVAVHYVMDVPVSMWEYPALGFISLSILLCEVLIIAFLLGRRWDRFDFHSVVLDA